MLPVANAKVSAAWPELKPLPLTNGYRVTGTITTNGTVGPLTSANIVAWTLRVVQTTDRVWTETDSAKNNTRYRAASSVAGQPNVFRIHVPTLATDPVVMTLFGTITTDGTIGPLTPQNLVAWHITARNQETAVYTEANSTVLSASGVRVDAGGIKVDRGGQFQIGIAGRRPTFVTLADVLKWR